MSSLPRVMIIIYDHDDHDANLPNARRSPRRMRPMALNHLISVLSFALPL